MGYNIELSFNIMKQNINLLNTVQSTAEECLCDNLFDDYEFDNNTQFQRRHCVISVRFPHERINNMTKFLNIVKKIEGLHIEVIYDELKHSILYASQYFITQKMDKNIAKKFNIVKRERSYSDDETKILNSVSK